MKKIYRPRRKKVKKSGIVNDKIALVLLIYPPPLMLEK